MAAMEQETIVAISTPVGRGGIGVVRLSGPHACDVVAPLLRLRHPLAAGRARFGAVIDGATDAVLESGASPKMVRMLRRELVLLCHGYLACSGTPKLE